MKAHITKLIKNMEEANEMSEALKAYNLFMAGKQEDKKLIATYKMRADSFTVTIEEKSKEIATLKEFLISLEGIPYNIA